MNLARRTKKRTPRMPRVPLAAPTEANPMWALDFMYDTLHYGRPFRTLNIINESNREILAGSQSSQNVGAARRDPCFTSGDTSG